MTLTHKSHLSPMAKAGHLPDFGSTRAYWKTEPIDEAPVPDRHGAKPLRVAIADDCKDNAEALAMLVRHWGYETEVAYGGAEAFQLIKACDPDVVIMDIAMPRVTGWQVARHLRRLPRFEPTLFIALTGYADKVHRETSLAAGFDYFFAKPCDPQELKNALWLFRQIRSGGAGVMSVR